MNKTVQSTKYNWKIGKEKLIRDKWYVSVTEKPLYPPYSPTCIKTQGTGHDIIQENAINLVNNLKFHDLRKYHKKCERSTN